MAGPGASGFIRTGFMASWVRVARCLGTLVKSMFMVLLCHNQSETRRSRFLAYTLTDDLEAHASHAPRHTTTPAVHGRLVFGDLHHQRAHRHGGPGDRDRVLQRLTGHLGR